HQGRKGHKTTINILLHCNLKRPMANALS
ncbi:hypothetical protein KSS87_000424, partial [Heliosperma pusillum]